MTQERGPPWRVVDQREALQVRLTRDCGIQVPGAGCSNLWKRFEVVVGFRIRLFDVASLRGLYTSEHRSILGVFVQEEEEEEADGQKNGGPPPNPKSCQSHIR